MDIAIRIGAAILVAFLISLIAMPFVKKFAHRVGAIDVPKDARRVHKHPIPRLGGLAIFVGFLLGVVLFAEINRQIQGILLGAVVIVTLGVVDDIKPLPALFKFFIQILAALVAVYHGVVIEFLSNPILWNPNPYIYFGVFSAPITVFWIVAITNSVNLIDGLDGLAAGVSIISSIVMLIIALLVAEPNVAIIMAALAGACLGFLPYNFNPAKIFMGDTGALLLGYVLATVSILGLFKFHAVVSFAVPFLALALPLFDTSLAFFRRLLKGQNPMAPDRGHFHHRLLDMGLSQKQAVVILYIISALLGLCAVVITTNGEIRAIIFIAAVLVAAGIVYFVYRRGKRASAGETPEEHAEESIDAAETPADAAEIPVSEAEISEKEMAVAQTKPTADVSASEKDSD